jgi:hypothetical protein
MAAHVLAFLKEVAEGKSTAEQVLHALSYAPLGDNMDWDDWQDFYRAEPSMQKFQKMANDLLDKYTKMWHDLGEPNTAEAWQRAKFPGKAE